MKNDKVYEVNFDGLVGPTHNHAGLSFGNVASGKHAEMAASPKKAALQGLEKMKALADLGLKQGVLPPHERPHLPTLKRLGFQGSDSDIIAKVLKEAPHFLRSVSSASNMWVANAATVSPFLDTADGKTHFTPANLCSMFHRAIEPETTGRILQGIFSSGDYVHHAPLPSGTHFSDEGAANHTRFCEGYDKEGVEFFVYGASSFNTALPRPQRYPARQTLEASETIARIHRLNPAKTVFAQQNPAAIDAGVFHNDVIAVGNRNVLFYHEQAFVDTPEVIRQLNAAYGGDGLVYIEVAANQVPLKDAVSSYLFNSQLICPEGAAGATLVVPRECREISSVNAYLEELSCNNPHINKVMDFDLRQSMRNGGGPACLRLRVVLSQLQLESLGARVILDESLYQDLKGWINRHYRDTLLPEDLKDPALLVESRQALDELVQLLHLGAVYEFQSA
ncbi:N-succinylarginine dihydrolase [Marinibactrum halimedae]|uniref:N-succinylarginine dihydrolase n=1 Tax=Marinibactrum halimedae TaxID=1444977 RepID=A0AA37T3T3_9GAMM|nr:N-succinylarginine dihydrolase [Marinibactrum halimedae]MCD9460181.1 N-succinylarginine dihydrolase [Marinibactrum halimedae]GLS26348.1 N-succinylarginine dihydrolase [Marinibactrum halimedae]